MQIVTMLRDPLLGGECCYICFKHGFMIINFPSETSIEMPILISYISVVPNTLFINVRRKKPPKNP